MKRAILACFVFSIFCLSCDSKVKNDNDQRSKVDEEQMRKDMEQIKQLSRDIRIKTDQIEDEFKLLEQN